MESLELFLHPVQPEEREIALSTRFCDENGNMVKWRLRAVTAQENEELIRRYSRRDERTGETHLDGPGYRTAFTAAGVAWPDLESSTLQNGYGVLGKENLLKKMMLAGELMALYGQVSRLSGFEKKLEEEAETVKNG